MPEVSSLHPERLLPADPRTRLIARELYERVAGAPIISPHGHVPASWLAEDSRFSDPADLLVVHDHYVTRLLHANGVSLDRLGATGTVAEPREIWRALCEGWHLFAGTASAYWLRDSLIQVFGIAETPSADTADAIFDRIDAALATAAFRPRALFERFGIEVLATTDDPLDTLDAHATLAADPAFRGRVLPTFRPDAYLDPAATGFRERVDLLLATTESPTTFGGYVDALRARRAFFIERGAVSADHGVVEPYTCAVDRADAAQLFTEALDGTLSGERLRTFRGHMLWQMAAASVDDGLVMTVHPGVRRNHHAPTFERFGPDSGHDIPLRVEYTDNIRALLQSFGTAPGFHLVLFAIDETVFSRELAPLAGFYPSVYVGAPWWFLDAPDAMARFRSAITETAGFYRTSGFIDDTRAYLSIPARHDVARRADASYLARLVAEGRLDPTTAARVIDDSVDALPRKVFKL